MVFPKGGAVVEDTVLFGKYRIERIIGQGRSGTVFLAFHLELGELRAIKRVERRSDERVKEACMLTGLRHPGIPIIYDLEKDSHYYYLIEEYLDGESLYARVQREGSLKTAEVISRGMELCRIIQYLHSCKPNPILYLDLQPHNILICRGVLKLIDFDQAVFFSCAYRPEKRYGTRGFAAPEQYTDEPLDERTDIYAIGGLLLFMLTGQPPGEGMNSEAEIPKEEKGLAPVIRRCLNRRKQERYASTQEVLEELSKLQSGAFTGNEIPLLRIAAVGSRRGIGVTRMTFLLAEYLQKQGISCLYREENDSGDVRKLAAYRKMIPDESGIYRMKDLALRPRYGDCVTLEIKAAEAILSDYGTGLQPVQKEDCDLMLLLCGAADWEMEDSIRAIRFLKQRPNLRILFGCIPDSRRVPLPADLMKCQMYRIPCEMLSASGTEGTLFWEAVVRGTEAERKLKKLAEAGTRRERKKWWKFSRKDRKSDCGDEE